MMNRMVSMKLRMFQIFCSYFLLSLIFISKLVQDRLEEGADKVSKAIIVDICILNNFKYMVEKFHRIIITKSSNDF